MVQASRTARGGRQWIGEGSTGIRAAEDPVQTSDFMKIHVLLSFSLEEIKVFWALI